MNATDAKVLIALDRGGGTLNARALAIATGAGYSSITASLRRLKAAGEIDMAKDGATRRKPNVTKSAPTGIAAGVLRVLRKSGVRLTAYAISEKLGKSAGAVANACERLRERGVIHVAGRKPRTYEVA